MKVVGLTGGIGSGKSTVSVFFKNCGASVIDADQIAHQLLHTHPDVHQKLRETFGTSIFSPNGSIDRRALGSLVFSDSSHRQRLESILHPLIRKVIQDTIENYRQSGSPLVLIDAALLVETGFYKNYDGLIVVKADERQQIERVKLRENLTEDEILQRISQQLPLLEKLKVADWVIDNSQSLDKTKNQVDNLYQSLTAS